MIRAMGNFIADSYYLCYSVITMVASFCLPVIGGLLVGLIIRFLYTYTSGSGTDEMIRSFHYRDRKYPRPRSFF